MDLPTALRDILILLGLFLLNGFFSLSEMAMVSSRRARLKTKAEEGKKSWQAALKASEEPASYLSTIQIGITLIGTLSGAFGGTTLAKAIGALIARSPALARYAQPLGMAIVVLLITFFSIVIGELVPKRIALSSPEPIAAGWSSAPWNGSFPPRRAWSCASWASSPGPRTRSPRRRSG